MKLNSIQKLPKQGCKNTYSGEHEWQFKWELPDRECYKCKKCGIENILNK
jgi:hypothetical protein